MRYTGIIGIMAVLALTGAGCVRDRAEGTTAGRPVSAPSSDTYEGWGEIRPGSVVSLRIPPGCHGDPGAGNIYVVCPTADDPEPDPVMHTSSDGITVNIGRWEGTDGPVAWDEYDKAVASLRVLRPMDRDIEIHVEY